MKCLVIAAGKGSRLRGIGDCKPLVSILGIPLIERVIRTAREAGVDDFYVTTGYQGERIRAFLDRLADRLEVHITHIVNEDWEKENGLSVLKARDYLREPFLLLMADHIIDGSILVKLKNKRITDGEVLLAVDYAVEANKSTRMNDATKVFVKGNSVTDIGKNIEKSNAYDTGIFLCSTAIFDALERSLEDGDSSLSGGIRVMAQQGKVKVFDIGHSFWVDVDDGKQRRKAERLLCGNLIKPADGLISRCVNRRFSIGFFTPLFLRLYKDITPNQVSTVSFVIGLVSSFTFFIGYAAVGGLLIQISSILDGCDGEIARLKDMESSLGDFVDAVLDRYADGFIFLGIFYYSLTEVGNKEIFGIYWSPLIISIIFGFAILGNLMVSYTSAKSVVNFGYRYRGSWIAAGRGRDIRLFQLFIGGIMTYFNPIFALIAVLTIAIQTNVIVLWRTFLSWSWFRKEDFLLGHRINAIIFDFDGTVANTMPFLTDLAVSLMTEHHNISEDVARKRYLENIGMDFASQIELIFPNHPRNQEVVNAFESKKEKGILRHFVFPEVISTLRYFSNRKVKTFVCSSTRQEIITNYVKSNKIGDLLDSFFGYKVDFGKGEQIDFILEHYELSPEEVLFVGDSLRDFDYIKGKKINFIGITRIFDQKDFRKRGLLSVSSLTDLVKLFDESERYCNALEKVR
ncbi:MAG: HAD hydrolase-like protein [Proteobacteria bacterium]|nr:HAD hydrolase-like protein [Pseudomonadota bacterium]